MQPDIAKRTTRPRIDDSELVRLWSSPLPDKVVADRLGCARGSMRRRAAAIGLPPRSVARIDAFDERAADGLVKVEKAD